MRRAGCITIHRLQPNVPTRERNSSNVFAVPQRGTITLVCSHDHVGLFTTAWHPRPNATTTIKTSTPTTSTATTTKNHVRQKRRTPKHTSNGNTRRFFRRRRRRRVVVVVVLSRPHLKTKLKTNVPGARELVRKRKTNVQSLRLVS